MNDTLKNLAPYAIPALVGGVLAYMPTSRWTGRERLAAVAGGMLFGAGAAWWAISNREWAKKALTEGQPATTDLRVVPNEAQPMSNVG